MRVLVTYGFGSNLAGRYSIVEGDNYEDIRKHIFDVTNGQYAFDYTGDDVIDDMIKRHNLKEVPLQPMYPSSGSY